VLSAPCFVLSFTGRKVTVHARARTFRASEASVSGLGRLSLSDDGLRQRDSYVIEQVRSRRIPLVAVIGGGYSPDVEALAQRHAIVFEAMAAWSANE